MFVCAKMTSENIALMKAEAMGNIVKEVSELLRSSAPARGVVVTSVAAGLMAEAWTSNGLAADEMVALFYDADSEEAKGLLAVFYRVRRACKGIPEVCGHHDENADGASGVNGERQTCLIQAAQCYSGEASIPKLLVTDVESDEEADTLKMSRFGIKQHLYALARKNFLSTALTRRILGQVQK